MKPLKLLIILTLRLNQVLAQPFIEVEIDKKIQPIAGKISVNSGYHEIVFRLPQAAGSSYEYQIPEIENEWNVSTFPIARYTNLPGGKYQFQFKVKNESQITSIPFEVKENFWEKWWFIGFVVCIMVLVILLVLYFWYLYDLRQSLKTQKIRQKIAADLHDEVGSNLSSIGFLVESMKRNLNGSSEKLEPFLEKISENSHKTAGLISDTIWALNPDYDNFEKLLQRINAFAVSILPTKDISFELENKLPNQEYELNLEVRRNLFLIIKESINNIAKHSQASKAKISLYKVNNSIHVEITDNGIGFETDEIFEGNGLKNYELRSQKEKLEVSVQSHKGQGTKVLIQIYH